MPTIPQRPCVRCKCSTPVSVNTEMPEGVVCLLCQKDKLSKIEVRALQEERLAEIEAERYRLIRALGVYPTLN